MKDFFKDRNAQSFAFVIAILLVAVIAFSVWFICMGEPKAVVECKPDYYALATTVNAIDRDTDVVTCEDYNGNLWEFYGVGDWQVGDNANLLMDSKGTPSIYDDEIISTKYANWG